MKNLRKIALFLAIILITASFSGCNKKNEAVEGEKEISISVFDRGSVPTSEGNYQDNRWTKWINEQSGIKVNWIPIVRNQAQEKLNMLAAAGEAPDIICEYDSNYILQLYYNGITQPVDEYIEKYSTTYKNYLAEKPELKPYITEDGKMFAITSKRASEATANHGMYIRQDWLDSLGLSTPKTDEEFIEVARAFTNNDPDKNNKNDTMGIAMYYDLFMELYMADPLWYLENDTLEYGTLTDRFASYMGFVKRLYEEGLIDKEFFTDKESKNQRQFWVTGKAGIYSKQWDESGTNRDLMTNVPTADPMPLESVATKYGINGLWQESIPNYYAAFNANMKNPQAAVEFVDWLIDKGWFTLRYGNEGTHFNMINGEVPQTIDSEQVKTEMAYTGDYAFLRNWEMKPEWIPLMAASDPVSQDLARRKAIALEVAMKNKFRRDIPYNPRVPELSNLILEFTPKVADIKMQVILGGAGKTPEWGIAEIRNEWDKLGGKDIEKLVNDWYQKNKGDLNIK